MQDQKAVDKLNHLWEKAVKSATELQSAREFGAETMLKGIDEVKK